MGSTVLEINNCKDSKLKAIGICSLESEVNQKLKDKYGLKYAVNDYKELISKDDIDIIAVFHMTICMLSIV